MHGVLFPQVTLSHGSQSVQTSLNLLKRLTFIIYLYWSAVSSGCYNCLLLRESCMRIGFVAGSTWEEPL